MEKLHQHVAQAIFTRIDLAVVVAILPDQVAQVEWQTHAKVNVRVARYTGSSIDVGSTVGRTRLDGELAGDRW